MGLIIVLALASLAIAGSAAYFSVVGLAAMFSAAYWPVVIMGGSLELGKLVAASFVYRTWSSTGKLMKTYLIGAIFVLMLITSLGIFGFLSQGYGESTQQLQQVQFTIEAKQREVVQVDERLEQINRVIEAVPNNYVSKRIELQREFAPEVKKLTAKRIELRSVMAELQKKKVEADAHVGPIIYVAAMFGVDVQDAVKFFILALIIVFDPMAVILTLATNHAIEQWQLKRQRTLSQKREHELHLLQEKAAAELALAATQKTVTGTVVESEKTEIPAESSTTAPSQVKPSQDSTNRTVVTAVPAAVSLNATKRGIKDAPSVSEMNAVLQNTPSRAQNRERREAAKARAQGAALDKAPSLREGLELDDKKVLHIGGIDVHEAVIEKLSPIDQSLLKGLSRNLPVNTLAAKLSMSDVNIRKRVVYLADKLVSSGYEVDPKKLLS